MRRIHYAGDTLLLGDDVADALMDYAARLARQDSAVTITIRALDDGGTEHAVDILVGPATMMTATHVDSDLPEPDNAAVVADLARRVSLLESPPAGQGVEQPEHFDEY